MVIVERSEYKGNPMIEMKMNEWDKWPFRFGIKKARLILDCIEEIKQFVKDNEEDE